jgi:hypothetical protein
VNFRDRHHIRRTPTKTQIEFYEKKRPVRLAFRHIQTCQVMSVLDDFARMRLYGTRASEFELLAETGPFREARFRYRIIARHYRELANREEQADKARMAQHLELLRLKRRKAAE